MTSRPHVSYSEMLTYLVEQMGVDDPHSYHDAEHETLVEELPGFTHMAQMFEADQHKMVNDIRGILKAMAPMGEETDEV